MSEVNVPKLRFREFEGEWEKKDLKDIFQILSNKFNPKNNNENKKCIELEHLSQGTGELLGYTYSKNQESIKNKFENNQVLFGKLRPYLRKFWKANFEGVCSSEIWVLNGLNISNDYLFQLIQTNKFNQIANISSGSKMPRSDWKYIAEIPYAYPPKEKEQQKIANFLTSIDQKTEQLTKKEKLLVAYKKGVMQKIFSQEIRFRDENDEVYGDWVERKLGEIATLTSSKRVYLSDYVKNGIPFYRGKEISELKRNKIPTDILYISKKSYEEYKLKYGVPQVNDILITAVGTLGNILRIKNNSPFYFKDGNLIWLRNITEDSSFLEILLELNKREIEKHSIGSTQKALTMVELRKLKLLFPCLSEQTKIANFLSSIDKKIEQVNRQIEESKGFKKGLLQEMFV